MLAGEGDSAARRRASNPLQLSGSSLLGALARSSRLGGQSALLLRLLLAGQASRAAGERRQMKHSTLETISRSNNPEVTPSLSVPDCV
jgi:hypothetical protein